MLYYDWQYTLADNDLRKVETMSALAGVRVSYPMLHPDAVDVALAVPPRLMMPGMELRSFYKRAMRGFLPEEIISKKKHGFSLPFGLWLQDSPRLREQIHDNLSSLKSRRVIRPTFIDRLLDLHEGEDARHYGVFVWVLAMLEQWFHEHSVSPSL
jgi:asparagine synthase (glutamine-hydrolysing)